MTNNQKGIDNWKLTAEQIQSLLKNFFYRRLEAARLAKVDKHTINYWVNTGKIPTFALGNNIYIPRLPFDIFLKDWLSLPIKRGRKPKKTK